MKKKIIIGGTLEDAAKRVADVWHRAERGEKIKPQSTITFVTWAALMRVMTDKRHELLRHLHTHPAANIRALARALRRDYKNVHDDVTALASVGLIEQHGKALRADCDAIQATIAL
jgi:predicted transcriptional regulator